MPQIRPSISVVVPADMPISECIAKMREKSVGSVLVNRGSHPHDLVGIFTERDILMQLEQIRAGDHWDKPVSTVMRHPVLSISVYEMHKAAEMMIERGIRHLPVVYQDAEGHEFLAGMISMRDLFKNFVSRGAEAESGGSQGGAPPKILLVAAEEEAAKEGLKQLLSQNGRAEVRETRILELLRRIGSEEQDEWSLYDMKAVVIDLDRLAPALWSSCLQKLNHDPKSPRALIVFNPMAQEEKNVKALKALSKSGKFEVFSKPLNLLELLEHVESALGGV